MKIVNRKVFVALKEGIVFSTYQPQVFGELCIKGESINDGQDFYYQPLNDSLEDDGSADRSQKLDAAESGESIDIDLHYESRDGMFDDRQLYAIWEQKDVEQLISRLNEALDRYR